MVLTIKGSRQTDGPHRSCNWLLPANFLMEGLWLSKTDNKDHVSPRSVPALSLKEIQKVEALFFADLWFEHVQPQDNLACAWVPISPRNCKGRQKLPEDVLWLFLQLFPLFLPHLGRSCSPAWCSASPWPEEILVTCQLCITGMASKICSAMENKASSWEGDVPGQVS